METQLGDNSTTLSPWKPVETQLFENTTTVSMETGKTQCFGNAPTPFPGWLCLHGNREKQLENWQCSDSDCNPNPGNKLNQQHQPVARHATTTLQLTTLVLPFQWKHTVFSKRCRVKTFLKEMRFHWKHRIILDEDRSAEVKNSWNSWMFCWSSRSQRRLEIDWGVYRSALQQQVEVMWASQRTQNESNYVCSLWVSTNNVPD